MASSKKKYTGPCDFEFCERPKDDKSCRFRPAVKPELKGKQVCPNSKCQFWGGNQMQSGRGGGEGKGCRGGGCKEGRKGGGEGG